MFQGRVLAEYDRLADEHRLRVAERRHDFWESGMDLKLGDDIYDSFRTYQSKLLREYAVLGEEFSFRTIDARQSVDRIQRELRRQVGEFLAARAAK